MTGFTGSVTLTSTDPAASLPGSYTFTASDMGVHTFTVALATAGLQSITATTGSGSTAISASESNILVTGSVWIVNSNATVSRLSTIGAVLETSGPASTATAAGILNDNAGNAWSVSNGANALLETAPTGILANTYTGAGLNLPVAIAIDGAGQLWIANTNNSVSAFTSAGTALSPTTGYAATFNGNPSPLATPSSITVDQTGSVWITNATGNSVTRLLGAAAPVVAPIVTGVSNGTQGTRP